MCLRQARPVLILGSILVLASGIAHSAEPDYLERPGLTIAEGTPARSAGCEEIASSVSGLNLPEGERVDLWVSGPVSLVHTDGVLWYVAVCAAPGASVLCVTYSGNGLAMGNIATARGGMKVLDAGHAVLDPCLVSRD